MTVRNHARPSVARTCVAGRRLPMVSLDRPPDARMVLETLSFLAIFIVALLRLERWMLTRYVRQQAELAVAAKALQVALDAVVPIETTMTIAGTRALPRLEHRRLARFGLRPERARELLVFESTAAQAEWPRAVRVALRRLHDAGQVRGPGVPDALFGTTGLPQGDALYFALLDDAGGGTPTAIAFVDVRP